MKKKRIIICSSIIVVFVVIVAFIIKDKMVTEVKYSSKYNKAIGNFTAKTASELLKDSQGNTCYSPASLYATLTLVAEISTNESQEEILTALGVESIGTLEEYYKTMKDSVTLESESSCITLANSLWVTENKFQKSNTDIIESLENKLECEIFEKERIEAIEVNEWVSNKTKGLISKVIDKDDYNSLMVNSLYYNSKWAVEVSKMDEKQIFTLSSGEEVQADFLKVSKQRLYFYEAKEYTYVEIPLEEGEMVLVLPTNGKSLTSILDEDTLDEILSLKTSKGIKKIGVVNVKVPELSIEESIENSELKRTLSNVGIKQIYKNPQWISGVSGLDTQMVQNIKFIMNEKGIEAAAATVFSATVGISENPTIDLDITFDTPFMYILMKDGVPLFIGTVYNPVE